MLFFQGLLHLAENPLNLAGRLFNDALGLQSGIVQLETLASPLPAMFIARADSRVCTAWLTR
jgi:hypothetical protein